MKRIALALIGLVLLCVGCAKEPAPPVITTYPPEINRPMIFVSFDFERQNGSASNQFAVWIEDVEGNLVKTLCATAYTANGGYKRRPDSLAVWVSKALGVSDFDAVASATPQKSTSDNEGIPYTIDWDLTNEAGEAVAPGAYKFLVEGTLRWKNYVLFTGEVEVGGGPVSAHAVPAYFFEGEGRQPALDMDAVEIGMIANVVAKDSM